MQRLVLGVLFALVPVTAYAATEGERVTLRGELIDTWCYFSGVMGGPDAVVGSAHHTCAMWCAAGGIPVGMLGEDGETYMILKLPDDDKSAGGDTFVQLTNDTIEAEAMLYERDGLKYLVVSEITSNDGIPNRTHEDFGTIPGFVIPDATVDAVLGEANENTRNRRGRAFVSVLPAAADAECDVKGWGLSGEQPACFSAKVVDLLCEITGDCAEDCGGGDRQLGLLRADTGKIVYPQKNIQPAFNGAVVDLLPHCGQTIDVRGTMVGDEDTLKGAAQLFHLHQLRPEGGKWKKANDWVKAWEKANPDAAGKGPWFRRSPRIKAEIEEGGYLGYGPEADIEFIKDWY